MPDTTRLSCLKFPFDLCWKWANWKASSCRSVAGEAIRWIAFRIQVRAIQDVWRTLVIELKTSNLSCGWERTAAWDATRPSTLRQQGSIVLGRYSNSRHLTTSAFTCACCDDLEAMPFSYNPSNWSCPHHGSSKAAPVWRLQRRGTTGSPTPFPLDA